MRLILYQGCSLNWPNTWWGFFSDKTTKWHGADTNCHHLDQSIAEKKGKNTILNIFGNCTFFSKVGFNFCLKGFPKGLQDSKREICIGRFFRGKGIISEAQFSIRLGHISQFSRDGGGGYLSVAKLSMKFWRRQSSVVTVFHRDYFHSCYFTKRGNITGR